MACLIDSPAHRQHRKGLQFYNQLTELSATLSRSVKSFVSERRLEREKLAGQAEVQQRLSTAKPPPPPANTKPPVPPPPRSPPSIEASFASMNLQSRPSPPAKPTSYTSPVPPAQPQRPASYMPPPPPQLPRSSYAAPTPPLDPYAGLGLLGSSQYASPAAPPPPPSIPPRQPSFPAQPARPYASPGYPTTGFPAPPPPIQYATPPPSSTSPRPPTQYPIPPPPQGYNPQFYQGYGR